MFRTRFLLGTLALLLASNWARAEESASPELDLGARVQPAPAANRFSEPGYHVWCGAPVAGPDGRYHLFYSRWPAKKGFAPGWAIHSEIAYAVAERPEGPYKPVNVALPSRGINPTTGKKFWDADVTHNANAFYHGGRYHLYYMGNHGDGTYWNHRNHQRIGHAWAENSAGPWTRSDEPIIDVSQDPAAFDALCVTNPAACLRPDGGVLVVYKAVAREGDSERGGLVRYGAALADTPDGPYRKVPVRIFEAPEADKQAWMLAEDPFIWFSERYGRRYYAIARDVLGRFTGAPGGIALFSSDDGLDWKPATHPKVLGERILLEGGGTTKTRAERPALLLRDGEPILLFGAIDGYNHNPGHPSSNIQIPLAP